MLQDNRSKSVIRTILQVQYNLASDIFGGWTTTETISLVTSRSTFLTSLDIRPTASEHMNKVSIIFSSSAVPTKSAENATRGFLSPYAPSKRPKHQFPQFGKCSVRRCWYSLIRSCLLSAVACSLTCLLLEIACLGNTCLFRRVLLIHLIILTLMLPTL